jgi:hypothetical protein
MLSLDKGDKLKECHGDLQKERGLLGYGRKNRKKGGSVRNLLILMCAKIKHGGNVCKNQA